MTLAVLLALPWLLTLLLTLTCDRLVRIMGPRASRRLLPVAAVATAGACGFSLTVLAVLLLSHASPIAAVGRWSAPALPGAHVPWPWGLPVAAVVTALLGSALLHTVRVGRQLWLAEATCRDLGAHSRDLAEATCRDPGARSRDLGPDVEHGCTVVAAPEPDAYAVPGLRGRIVVSSGMLAVLDEPQRQALLAHERSHLAHRHHLWIQATEIAAAANPLLRAAPALVRAATEREADLDAAAAVGDPEVTAQAIAAAALARTSFLRSRSLRAGDPRLAATGGDVVDRVQHLRGGHHAHGGAGRRPAAGVLLVVIAAAVLTTAASAELTEDHFDRAQLVARWDHHSGAGSGGPVHARDTTAPPVSGR